MFWRRHALLAQPLPPCLPGEGGQAALRPLRLSRPGELEAHQDGIGFPLLSGRNRCDRIPKYGPARISMSRVTQRQSIYPILTGGMVVESRGRVAVGANRSGTGRGSPRCGHCGRRSDGPLIPNQLRPWTGPIVAYGFTCVDFDPRRIGLVLFTVLVPGNYVTERVRHLGGGERGGKEPISELVGALHKAERIKAAARRGRLSLKEETGRSLFESRKASSAHEWIENIWINHWTPLWIQPKVQIVHLIQYSSTILEVPLCFDSFDLQYNNTAGLCWRLTRFGTLTPRCPSSIFAAHSCIWLSDLQYVHNNGTAFLWRLVSLCLWPPRRIPDRLQAAKAEYELELLRFISERKLQVAAPARREWFLLRGVGGRGLAEARLSRTGAADHPEQQRSHHYNADADPVPLQPRHHGGAGGLCWGFRESAWRPAQDEPDGSSKRVHRHRRHFLPRFSLCVRLPHAAGVARVHQPEQLRHEPRPVRRRQLPLHHDQLPAPVPPTRPERGARIPPFPALAERSGDPLAALRRHEGGTSDGAGHAQQRQQLAANVSHRFGESGEDQSRAQAAEEPDRRVQVSEAQVGAHRSSGGQGEGVENGQRRPVEHGFSTAGAGGSAQTESHDACEQWLSAHVSAQSEVLLEEQSTFKNTGEELHWQHNEQYLYSLDGWQLDRYSFLGERKVAYTHITRLKHFGHFWIRFLKVSFWLCQFTCSLMLLVMHM